MSVDSGEWYKAIQAIRNAKSIALACHVNPDGDALGSLIALGLTLNWLNPETRVELLSHDGVPDIYEFLRGSDKVRKSPSKASYDLAIALDSGNVQRTGEGVSQIFESSKLRMDIDHHVGDGAFGDIRLLDSSAAATAEIVYDLLDYLDAPIPTDVATCLLTGIITDTGSFRFLNVTAKTLKIASHLVERGASPSLIAEKVFDNRTFSGTKLLGLCLSSMQIVAHGSVAYASVQHEDFVETGASDEDTEGYINFIRSIRGTEVALLFREIEVGTVRVSLRSSSKVDVAQVAGQFGGGGHKMAAGCTFSGTLAEAQTALLDAVCGLASLRS